MLKTAPEDYLPSRRWISFYGLPIALLAVATLVMFRGVAASLQPGALLQVSKREPDHHRFGDPLDSD